MVYHYKQHLGRQMQDIPDLKPQSKTSFPSISYSKWISIVIGPHLGLLHLPTSHSINIFIPTILASQDHFKIQFDEKDDHSFRGKWNILVWVLKSKLKADG
jgi:hypothetical protein